LRCGCGAVAFIFLIYLKPVQYHELIRFVSVVLYLYLLLTYAF